MSRKWKCEICHEVYPTKKELVEDLKGHFEEATQDADEATALLAGLGITNPYYE